jgi:hypothetical protein
MKTLIAITLVTALVAACGEAPQDAPKSYAGRPDEKPYASDKFKGDKAKYETTLAERANYQNEYARATWK